MSEHTKISGMCDYLHMPYREERGFTYCKRCKRFVDKIEIQFNEGWFNDWQQVNCGHCHKVIWVCSFKNKSYVEELHKKQNRGKKEEYDIESEGSRIFIKDDKKCCICRKPTNHYDCSCYGGRLCEESTKYLCSKKCSDIQDKIDMKINFYLKELYLCEEEQGLKIEGNLKLKVAKENEKHNKI